MSPEAKVAPEAARVASNDSLKDSPQRWWLMALLLSGMIFCYAQRGAINIAAPFISRELGLSTGEIGLLFSAFFWTYSFMQMPAGWVVDRVGVKRAYALGFIFWSLASALTGFAKNLVALIALRMSLGVGQAVAFPASSRAVANWFQDRERGTVTACYLVGVRMGTALVNLVGAFVLALYGWKTFFLVIGLLPLLWLLPWLGFLRKWGPAPADSAPRPLREATPKSLSFTESLALLKHRTVLGIFIGFFAYDYVWFLYVNWLPGYLKLERNFSPQEIALYSSLPFAIMSGVGLASGLLSDWLIRRGGDERRVRKAFINVGLIVACLIVPAGFVEDKMTAVWLLGLSLVGLGISSPNTWTLTQAVCPKSMVGTVTGIQNFGGNVGGGIAPLVTGLIAQATGSFALALAIAGAVLVVGVLSYWLLIAEKVEAPLPPEGLAAPA